MSMVIVIIMSTNITMTTIMITSAAIMTTTMRTNTNIIITTMTENAATDTTIITTLMRCLQAGALKQRINLRPNRYLTA